MRIDWETHGYWKEYKYKAHRWLILAIVIGIGLGAIVCVPQTTGVDRIWVCVGLGFFLVCPISMVLLTVNVDPGVMLPKAEVDEVIADIKEGNSTLEEHGLEKDWSGQFVRKITSDGHVEKIRYCSTCNIWRPHNASHCRVCGYCMRRFDHHCSVIGTCVAEGNHRWFVLLLLGGGMAGAFVFTATLLVFLNHSPMSASSWTHSGAWFMYLIPPTLVFTGYIGLAINLFGLGHLSMLCAGTTTRLTLRDSGGEWERVSHCVSCWEGWRAVWCAPIRSRWTLPRVQVDPPHADDETAALAQQV